MVLLGTLQSVALTVDDCPGVAPLAIVPVLPLIVSTLVLPTVQVTIVLTSTPFCPETLADAENVIVPEGT